MNKTLEYYLPLSYTRELVPAPGGRWFARIKELPGCASQGITAEAALHSLEDALAGWLQGKLAAGEAIPEPPGLDWSEAGLPVQEPLSPLLEPAELSQARWCLQTGHAREAAALVRLGLRQGRLADAQQPEWLRLLGQAAIDGYVHGDLAVAKEIFALLEQLVPPDACLTASDGDRWTAEGSLEQAEIFFRHALEKENDEPRGVLFNKLGYLHLLLGHYEQADWAFQAALMEDDAKAVLRVAFWMDGGLLPKVRAPQIALPSDLLAESPASHFVPLPAAASTIYLVALANQAALSLAQGDLQRAVLLLKTMQVYEQEAPLTLQVWGCVARAQGNPAKAREVWNHAIRLLQDPRAQKMLLDWLET